MNTSPEMNTRRRTVGWSSLPNELLTMISDRLHTRIDVLRFRAVCRPWRSSIPLSRKSSPNFPMKLPYPIVPESVHHKTPIHFTLTESTLYRFESLDQDKMGSDYSGAWLVKVEEFKPGKFRLLNPLSHHQIKYKPEMFPKNLNLLDYRVFELGKAYKLEYVSGNYSVGVDKAIFSTEHSSVLVIYNGGQLAFLRLGDEKWTQLGEPWNNYYRDIMLYMGEFHAIEMWGKLKVIDSSTLKITEVSCPMYNTGSKKHLLQSCGALYVVDRYLDTDRRVMYYDENSEEYYYKKGSHCVGKTVDFEIYKLNQVERDWVKVQSLADQVMFLGDDCSFISSPEELAGCRGNCIYFTDKTSFYYRSKTDDVLEGLDGHDTALFNIEDRSISGLATGPGNFQVIWPPPTWLKSN